MDATDIMHVDLVVIHLPFRAAHADERDCVAFSTARKLACRPTIYDAVESSMKRAQEAGKKCQCVPEHRSGPSARIAQGRHKDMAECAR